MENVIDQETVGLQGIRGNYADLLNDFMFKRIFGSEENKDVLIAFLNRMLKDVEIEDVTFIETHHLGETADDRQSVFDLSCRCRNGSTFIVEMQKARQKNFRERALYYTSYPILEQGRKARERYERVKTQRSRQGLPVHKFKWEYDLKPVIMVSILNFKLEHCHNWPQERCYSSYSIREETYGERLTNNLRYVFLELGRFKKEVCDLVDPYEKWMYLFCHMPDLPERPEGFDEIEFDRLFNLANINNFTDEELYAYRQSLEHMSDYLNTIDYARDEGRELGREEGREEGRRIIIRHLYSKGMPASQIADYLDMTLDKVESILAEK
ncbi:MAG: Rpn family recombination-promoting nuclease/putative transposase [Bacteroidales bacterium]|nr:Rpn family recombination-promoting nuclease/putative transposase [Bacteroidales bacterium]